MSFNSFDIINNIPVVYYNIYLSDEDFQQDFVDFVIGIKGVIFCFNGWNISHSVNYANLLALNSYFLYSPPMGDGMSIAIPMKTYGIINLGDKSCFAHLVIPHLNFQFLIVNAGRNPEDYDKTLPMILTGPCTEEYENKNHLHIFHEDEIFKFRSTDHGFIEICEYESDEETYFTYVNFSVDKKHILFYDIMPGSFSTGRYVTYASSLDKFKGDIAFELEIERCKFPTIYLVTTGEFRTKFYTCKEGEDYRKIVLQTYAILNNHLPFVSDGNNGGTYPEIGDLLQDAPEEIIKLNIDNENTYALIVIQNFEVICTQVL